MRDGGMEVRVARREGDPALEVLAALGELVRALPGPQRAGVLAMGHGSREGVSNGAALGREFVLSVDDAPHLAGRWAVAFACTTAPEFISALVTAGVARAAGFDEELRLPVDLSGLPDPLPQEVARFIHEIATAVGEGQTVEDVERRVYFAQQALFALISAEAPGFMWLAFVEQLRSCVQVLPRR